MLVISIDHPKRKSKNLSAAALSSDVSVKGSINSPSTTIPILSSLLSLEYNHNHFSVCVFHIVKILM